MQPSSALIIGHYCHDTLYLANGNHSATLGGSASYISSVFEALGVNCSVVAKVGPDFAYFSQITHTPKIISNSATTHFIADFRQGERIGKVGAVCEPIYPEDIPDNGKFELGLAVGIVGEVLPETLERLSQSARYVLCDMQGLVRKIDQENVGYQRLEETPYFHLLNKITFLKANRQEAELMDLQQIRQQTCVLVTEGKEGCTVYTHDREFRVPAFETEEVDPTGAGDCFFAGFAAGLLRGYSLEKSVLLGNYFGSLAVGQVGVPCLDGMLSHPVFESV